MNFSSCQRGDNFKLNKILHVNEASCFPFQIYFAGFLSKNEDILYGLGFNQFVFSYCVEGCFEVEERMLFAGDRLVLPGIDKAEVECLSERGMIKFFVL